MKDLEIVQDRDEFLESLDSWEDAIRGGTIDARLSGTSGELMMVEVCYRFPSNEQLNLEVFRMTEKLFTRIVQEKKAEDCSGF